MAFCSIYPGLEDFKEEMQAEPMAGLWGNRSDYEKFYAEKCDH